jgi:hypothetical protein
VGGGRIFCPHPWGLLPALAAAGLKFFSLIFILCPVQLTYYSSGHVTSCFESVKRVLSYIRGRPEHLPAHRGERARVGRHLRPQPRASTSGATGCPGQGGLPRSAHCSFLYFITYKSVNRKVKICDTPMSSVTLKSKARKIRYKLDLKCNICNYSRELTKKKYVIKHLG